MRRSLAGAVVGLVCACSEVRVAPDESSGGAGGTIDVGGGGQGGTQNACTPLPDANELGCIERNNPTASVEAEIDDEHYLSYIALSRGEGIAGYVCATGPVTLGGSALDAPPFPASSCFRLESDVTLSALDVSPLPIALSIHDTLARSSVTDRTLVTLPPTSTHGAWTTTDRAFLGVLAADGELPWMRPLFVGTATDNLAAAEHPLLLANGDVAISVLLGTSAGGTIDFGDGFAFEDDGQATTAYVARLDGSTGQTIAAFTMQVEPNATQVLPIEGEDGSFTAILFGSEDGSPEHWARWFDLDGETAVEIAAIDEASPGSRLLVDGLGRLWFNQWEGEAGVRVVGRDGQCSTAKEFDAGPPFYALDLALLPSSNLAVLLSVYGERALDGCNLADPEGDGDLFAAELSAEGDWVRVVRLSSEVPEGAMLLDATQDDLVVFILESDGDGLQRQRVERIDWGEAAF